MRSHSSAKSRYAYNVTIAIVILLLSRATGRQAGAAASKSSYVTLDYIGFLRRLTNRLITRASHAPPSVQPSSRPNAADEWRCRV
eukprot:scaffold26022_cov27-Prasinocladus_malaysianus.AAC.1